MASRPVVTLALPAWGHAGLMPSVAGAAGAGAAGEGCRQAINNPIRVMTTLGERYKLASGRTLLGMTSGT
jgi:hypothetical protein